MDPDEQATEMDEVPKLFDAFPYQPPYPIQTGFMQAAYSALQQGGVCLLESPTGTGKTISIICSVSKWLEDHRQQLLLEQEADNQAAAAAASDEPDWLREVVPKQSGTSGGSTQQPLTLEQRRIRHQARAVKPTSHNTVTSLWPSGSSTAGRTHPGSQGNKQPTQPEDEFVLHDTADNTQDLPSSSDSESDLAEVNVPLEEKKQNKLQIIFCTRTHSQLSQFVSELKRTAFASRLSLVAVASRKVLCINEEVRGLQSGSLINQRCLDMQSQRSSRPSGGVQKRAKTSKTFASHARCPYLINKGPALEAWQDEVLTQQTDIEELAHVSRGYGVCGYYAGRSLLQEADIILAPYASILQKETRQALKLRLEGSVLVVDEAHNLVQAINNMHSSSVTGQDLSTFSELLANYSARVGPRLSARNAQHVQLLQKVLNCLSNALCVPQISTAGTKGIATGGQQEQQGNIAHGVSGAVHTNQAGSEAKPGLSDPAGQFEGFAMSINQFLFNLELDDINMFELLAWVRDSKLQMKLASYTQWQSQQPQPPPPPQAGEKTGKSKSCQMSTQNACSRSGDTSFANRAQRLSALQACVSFLTALTSNDADGRVLVVPPTKARSLHASNANDPTETGTLKFVLLNAAAHFGHVLSTCHAVLLASGTLSPVDGLLAQLFAGTGLQLHGSGLQQPHVPPVPGVKQALEVLGTFHSNATTSPDPAICCTIGKPQGHSVLADVQNIEQPACHQQQPQKQEHKQSQQAQTVTCTRPLLHYSCGHVVSPDQVVVLVAGQGPSGHTLDLRAAHRTLPATMDEVGRLLLNICRVVPGGVVAFAPSFKYLQQLHQHWLQNGCLTALQSKKAVFIEPRAAADVESTLQQYAAIISACSKAQGVNQAGVTGGLLLGVVGGKLSEGINFGDDLGRCVVVLGLPYANPADPELQERMAFLDTKHRAQEDPSSKTQDGIGLTGKQLYESMCMNAVNQCVGRVVRHENDYAAVVLADIRYVQSRLSYRTLAPVNYNTQANSSTLTELQNINAPVTKLPAWMLDSLSAARQDYGFLHSSLAKFFRARTSVT